MNDERRPLLQFIIHHSSFIISEVPMPTWLKVVLIVGGLLVVLGIAAAVGLFFVARKYGPALLEAGKHSMEEGREYGRRTDNEGCLNEAVARHSRADGLGAVISNNIFFRACLEASRPTPHFCDDVPRPTEFMKSAHWQLDECKRYGLSTENQCGQLFQQVQQFCELRGRGVTGGARDYDPTAPPEAPPPPTAPNAPSPR
jgi:hypothetical protein